jgi:epoxyqueuosine reductase
MDTHSLSLAIKRKISESGYLNSGFARAELLQRDYDFFLKWLAKGNHAQKAYLEKEPLKRADPRLLVKGARSVISILFSYFTAEDLSEKHFYKISKYGYGRDYHIVLKEKLNDLVAYIKTLTQTENTIPYVDAAPVFEKAWAQRCGLGWTGKNTLLINKNLGTFHFIGTIITDVELEYDVPAEEACGSCRLCMDACPTGALIAPHEIDVKKCISHLTMEQKNALPGELIEKFNNYIYGCDICQDCCPWNKNLQACGDESLYPSDDLEAMTKNDWEILSENKFNELFHDSAVARVGFNTLKRNIDFIRDTP